MLNLNNFSQSLQELKLRGFYSLFSFIFTFFICYLYINQIIFLLTNFLLSNMNSPRFIFNNITEILYTYIKFAFITTFLICIPFISLNV